MCIHRIMKFLEQFEVVSRRNKTIRKAFVVTGQPFEGYTMMPLMLCQEPKKQIKKVNQTVRQSCSNLKEALYVISFHFDLHR